MGDITGHLARHVASTTYADLPPEAVTAARHSLLDAIGVSAAASALEPACAPFAELAEDRSGPCTVLGYRRRASPLMAAFANGALAHALDFEDAYDGAPAHPNAASVPVALALAERDSAIDGKRLLAALAIGSDLVCRLASALPDNPDRHGFYTPAVLSTFGAAATAASLLRLDEDGVRATLALALSQSMASSQFKADPASPVRAIREAFPARAGLTAAMLAEKGAGGFGGAIDGTHGLYAVYARGAPRRGELLEGLGARFLGAEVSYKPWPSCRGTHAFIEAALALKWRHGFSFEEVTHVEARGAALNTMLMEPEAQKRRPGLAIDAKFSLPFCIASALVHDAVNLDSFTPARLADARVLSLAEKVSFTAEPGSSMRDATGGELELGLAGGARHTLRVEHPLGHPSSPLDEEALVEKFVDCVGRAVEPLDTQAAHEVARTILRLESAESTATALRPLLV